MPSLDDAEYWLTDLDGVLGLRGAHAARAVDFLTRLADRERRFLALIALM